MTDHELAAWLRARNAVDSFEHYLNSVRWFNPERQIVAFAIYDNTACTHITYIKG